jgi:F-type H+-transporting ATPase subunit a
MSAAEHAGSGGQTGSEYIIHHLQNLQHEVGSSTLNIDSLFFSITLGLLFVISFYLAARKANLLSN